MQGQYHADKTAYQKWKFFDRSCNYAAAVYRPETRIDYRPAGPDCPPGFTSCFYNRIEPAFFLLECVFKRHIPFFVNRTDDLVLDYSYILFFQYAALPLPLGLLIQPDELLCNFIPPGFVRSGDAYAAGYRPIPVVEPGFVFRRILCFSRTRGRIAEEVIG